MEGMNLEICKFSHTTKQLLVVEHPHPGLVGHWPVPTVPTRHNELYLLRPVAMFPTHHSSNSLTLTMAGVIQRVRTGTMTLYLPFTSYMWLALLSNQWSVRQTKPAPLHPTFTTSDQHAYSASSCAYVPHVHVYPTALAPHTLCTVHLDFMGDYGVWRCMMNILIRLWIHIHDNMLWVLSLWLQELAPRMPR